MLSAWAAKIGLVMNQIACSEKSNEISESVNMERVISSINLISNNPLFTFERVLSQMRMDGGSIMAGNFVSGTGKEQRGFLDRTAYWGKKFSKWKTARRKENNLSR